MPNVGYATIQIIPSVRGIADELRRQLVGPAGDAGGDAGQAAGGGLKDKLKLGAAAAGAAAGALLVAGIGEAMDQANITGSLQAQLGTTNKVAASQGKIAGKLYSSGVSGSFQDAADAIKSVVQAGLAPPGTTNAQLQQIATKASDVANVFGQDLGGVTNAVSQMMRTGLAKNSTEAFDLITKGFQSGANKADDLLDTFNEYGTSFRSLGLSGKDAMGLIQQGLKGGARDADQVADALKEFSLVASQGGKATEEVFKSIGLNGKQMVQDVAAGGDGAREAVGKVLAKLSEMPNSAAKASAVKSLFGGPGEDLGASLFSLNLDKASASLGKVGGAADRAGKTIRSGPSHEIEIFTRSLKQGFVDFIGGQVLPVVSQLAQGFNTYLLPPLRTIGSVVAATLIPALKGILSAGLAVIQWLREWGVWLAPIAVLIGGITLALNAQAIATGLVTTVFSVYRAAMLVGTAVTTGFAGAQALLNSVMALNPFVLIAIALVALGVALFVAWKKSETFRNIVLGAWSAIQTAALWLWNNALKPFFSWFGQIVTWLYNNVIKVYFALVVAYFKTVGAIALWLWNNAISPVIGWIVTGFKLWWTGVKLYFSLVMAGFRAVGAIALWLWNNAISPVVGWIVTGFKLMWAGVKVVFGWFVGGVKTLASWAKWLWTNGIKPAFNGIKSVISTVYSVGIKPVFDKLRTAVGLVGTAFGKAKDAIKIAWDKISGIARKPVAFIVNTVYSQGIRKVWNLVAGAFGAPKLAAMKFASGGVLPGYTPGRDPHKFFSPTGGALEMSGGEAIMRPEFTRAVGGGFVSYFNRVARTRGASGVKAALAPTLGGNPRTPTQRFAGGGIFGWIGKTVSGVGSATWDTIKKGASWLKGGVESSMRAGVKAVVDPLMKSFPGMDTALGKMLRRIPTKILDAIFGYSKTADRKGAGGIGGPRVQAALSWARGQAGKRYQWGGNGNPSWDCSGFVSAIESVLRGQKPHRRWSTHAFSGATAPPGWAQNATSPFRIGVTNAGVGHTAGTLGGVNVESRGGDGVVVGKRARGYSSSLFTSRYGFTPAKKYDQGGWLQPGLSTVINKTGQPEAVLTPSQWQAVTSRAGQGGLDGLSVTVYVGDREITDIARTEVRRSNGELLTALSSRPRR
ncbi:phage tail tape measure protein [Streptomyces avermitilis]|uniref:phage tail tape measure protein n=1 Tax=Streptomyces avermitilis TaxID=33903 RepID=UPI00340F83B4